MKSLEDRVLEIEKRNEKVESDKAWETSQTRRVSIAVLTYVVVYVYLVAINNERPLINALVPTLGYLLSTLVMKSIRSLWSK